MWGLASLALRAASGSTADGSGGRRSKIGKAAAGDGGPTPQGRLLGASKSWLPFLNTYRTICIAPNEEMRALFEQVRDFHGSLEAAGG